MNATMKLYSSILVTVLGLGASLAACGEDTSTAGTSGGGGSSGTSTSGSTKSSSSGNSSSGSSSGSSGSGSSGSSSGSSSSSSSSGGGGGVMPVFKSVKAFETTESPAGLAVSSDGTTAFVGFLTTGKVLKVTLADGTVSDFGSVLPPPPGMPPTLSVLVFGLAIDRAGDVYVGVASFLPPGQYQPGIYKISKDGGAGTLFAKDAQLTFPNGLAFDSQENLFVTDSRDGTIFKITKSGTGATVTKWISHDLLKGQAAANPCGSGFGPDFGASGLLITPTEAYVANTDKATLIKIPISGGTAGAPTVLASSDATTSECLPLKGAEGITLDKNGDILVASFLQNVIYRIKKDGTGTPAKVAEMGPLDAPASIVYLSEKDEVLITNSGFTNTSGAPPKPSLVTYGPLSP